MILFHIHFVRNFAHGKAGQLNPTKQFLVIKKKKYYAKEETKVLDERVSTLALQLDDGARLFL
jgi:hypothetical protein